VGTDVQGRVHHVRATHAAEADIGQMPHLLHGAERAIYGDPAYWKQPTERRMKPAPCATASTAARSIARVRSPIAGAGSIARARGPEPAASTRST
jgi:hypothetical protein